MRRLVRKVLRAVADYDPDYYDMYADPNEAFFAQLYVERIKRHAEEAGIHPPATEPGTPPTGGVGDGSAEGRSPRPTEPGYPAVGGVGEGRAERGARRPTKPGAPCVARGGEGSAGVGGRPRPTLLEAGCQAGRLVIPFAKLGFRVTGIDTSRYALRRAQEHAKAAGVEATFVRGDLMEVLRRDPKRLFDIVVSAEVLYLSPRYREMLQALAGAVRPGGLLCVSHRPKLYYLLEAFRQYDLATADAVLHRNEGPFRDSAYYNWQTEEELRALYQSVGMQWRAMHPIDRFAWMSGKSPSQLTEAQREQWLKLELGWAGDTGACARYVLVVTSRPAAESHP